MDYGKLAYLKVEDLERLVGRSLKQESGLGGAKAQFEIDRTLDGKLFVTEISGTGAGSVCVILKFFASSATKSFVDIIIDDMVASRQVIDSGAQQYIVLLQNKISHSVPLSLSGSGVFIGKVELMVIGGSVSMGGKSLFGDSGILKNNNAGKDGAGEDSVVLNGGASMGDELLGVEAYAGEDGAGEDSVVLNGGASMGDELLGVEAYAGEDGAGEGGAVKESWAVVFEVSGDVIRVFSGAEGKLNFSDAAAVLVGRSADCVLTGGQFFGVILDSYGNIWLGLLGAGGKLDSSNAQNETNSVACGTIFGGASDGFKLLGSSSEFRSVSVASSAGGICVAAAGDNGRLWLCELDSVKDFAAGEIVEIAGGANEVCFAKGGDLPILALKGKTGSCFCAAEREIRARTEVGITIRASAT